MFAVVELIFKCHHSLLCNRLYCRLLFSCCMSGAEVIYWAWPQGFFDEATCSGTALIIERSPCFMVKSSNWFLSAALSPICVFHGGPLWSAVFHRPVMLKFIQRIIFSVKSAVIIVVLISSFVRCVLTCDNALETKKTWTIWTIRHKETWDWSDLE